jgi:DNA-binding IclR family transcriptional regulator
MRGYAEGGSAFDLEENEDQIRCVAAPIRDASGAIVGAISVSSAAQYMSPERMMSLSHSVRQTAADICQELGWQVRNTQPRHAGR